MRKTTFITIFITIILLANGEFLSSFALEEKYDAKNDIISQSYAHKIAEFKCMEFFGEKELFDIEKYYDETDRISVYVFIYKNFGHIITKQELLNQLESYNSEFQKAKNMIIEGGKEKDYSKVLQGRKLVHKYLKLINQKENFYSIYVSASKTHMPVIEWREGLPESYTMLASAKREIKEKIKKEPDDIRFYYFGPLELFAEGIYNFNQKIYLSLSKNLEEVDRSIINRFKFRLRLEDMKQETVKKLNATQHETLTEREKKIKKAWEFFKDKSQEELYSLLLNVEIQESHNLSNVPDFNQWEFLNLFDVSSDAGSCGVMAVADALGYYDHEGFWNLVDLSWFQGPDNHPDGGFYDDAGLNVIDEFLLNIAAAIGYDPNSGVAPAGLGGRIETFTNSSLYGNNLSFTIEEQASLLACTYETIKNRLKSNQPVVIKTNYWSWDDYDGKYDVSGSHLVVVKGFDTAKGYDEPICVYTNGKAGGYGDIWWNYADLGNLFKFSYEFIPGGNAGSFLDPPVLQNPEDGSIISTKKPTLEWQSVSGANRYRMQLATSADFSGNSYVYGTSLSEFMLSTDLSDGTYFWRVVPRNANNNWCNYSEPNMFTVNTDGILTFVTNNDSVSVPENGSNTFQVKLSSIPPANIPVIVNRLSGDSDISVSSGGSFTFTPSNWNDWRTVTLAAADDADASSDQATIQISASGIPNKNITAIEEDDDSLNFDTGWDEWPVDEGDTRTCGVRLTAQPASTITATVTKVSGDSDITIQSGSTLTFTTSDWNTWHHITFAAAQDLDAEDGTATVRIRASGVSDKYMPVVERDDDEMEFDIEGGISTLSVNEGGTNTFRVRLTAQPTSTILVNVYRLSGDSDISVQSGYSLTFTSSNYTQYQMVILAASEDSDTSNGQATIRMNDNGPIPGKNIIVTEQDNDSLSFLATMNELTIPEGETNNFQVKLSAQPSSDVTVSVTRVNGDSDITVQSGSSLTFTTSSWSQYQMVILAAADDADDTNGQATIRISASGIPNKDIIATEQDDDIVAPEISVKQGTTDISDGGSFNYGFQLVGINTDITFTIENIGTVDLILSGDPIITITGANADQFSVQQLPSSPVNAGNSTAFIVRFSPTSLGSKTASISIANNDSDENPYDITLNGTGELNWNQLIYSTFDDDQIDSPPQTGGINQPTSLVVPPSGYILVRSSVNGITTNPVEIYDGGSANYGTVDYSFGPLLNGIVCIEATVSLNNLVSGYFLQTSEGTSAAVITRFGMTDSGLITDYMGTILGNYQANTPFRVRVYVDMDAKNWSASIDNEMNGFDDDPLITGLSFLNDPGIISTIGRAGASLNTFQGSGDTSIAYDDIYVAMTGTDPYITSLSPNSGSVGTLVTINGTNFGSSHGTVTFNGLGAPITSWTDIQIITNVPSGASTGPVVVHTSDGKDSNGVTFSVTCEAPFITQHPQSQTIGYNMSASLSVIATGTGPLSYQWYEGNSGETSTPLGTNSASYTTPNLTETTFYWVRVTNACGSTDSDTAIITVSPPLFPEINIKQGTNDIPDGGSFNYSSQLVGTNTDLTFTIENIGTVDLILSGSPIITITGTNADQFNVQQQPSSPVNAGNSTTFIIRFSPTSEGTKTASISIANNDSDENPYDITLNGAGIPSSGVLFEEDWNSGVIDSNDWNFVDNIISWHGGHKASVVDGELFINAWDDWTCSCGIISKEGFPYNTRLSLKFRIHRIRVYNPSQSIICFSDSGGIDANGYTTGNELFSLWGGNDNNRTLFIRDNEGTEYSLGNYVPDQDYHLEVIFTSSETKVSANGYTITIPQAYSNYHIHFGGHVEDSYFDDLKICSSVHIKHDFLGTWTGQGVYYRNSDTGAWVKIASPAIQITAGDIDNDGIDDLIGIWPAQGGVWIKYSSIGMWARIASTADWICSGDMNGDGRVDFLGTWSGQGVYYMDTVNMGWVKLATPATQIAAGDIDGDGTDDLLGIWPAQGGIWVKYSSSGSWARLSSTADWIASGDMNGDGRCDLLGTWTDQGVYYKDSDTGSWVKMATSASQIAVGDIDGDGTDDLLGIWPAQGSVWVKYSNSGTWERLSSTADWIAAGRMREAGGGGIEIFQDLQAPIGGYAEGPESILEFADFSSEGPGGWNFVFQEEKNLVPLEKDTQIKLSIPGPGESWFRCIEQKNLVPQEGIKKKNRKRK